MASRAEAWICNLCSQSAQNSKNVHAERQVSLRAPFHLHFPPLLKGISRPHLLGLGCFRELKWQVGHWFLVSSFWKALVYISLTERDRPAVIEEGLFHVAMEICLKNEIRCGFANDHWWVSLQSGCLCGGVSVCNYLQSPLGEARSVWSPIGPDNSRRCPWGCGAHAKKAQQQLKKAFSLSSGVYLSSS